MVTIIFEKRKPSYARIMSTINKHIKKGQTEFDIIWGENSIQLKYNWRAEQWDGHGWIKDIDGDALAKTLSQIRRQTMKYLLTGNPLDFRRN